MTVPFLPEIPYMPQRSDFTIFFRMGVFLRKRISTIDKKKLYFKIQIESGGLLLPPDSLFLSFSQPVF